MDVQFGNNVYERALTLQEQGKDANQIAKILCDQDSEGHNYGIGIVLDGNGQPMMTHPPRFWSIPPPKARDDAPAAIYNEHIYPVFANQRCRQNVTGIPADEELAQRHVQVFAEQCY